MLTRRDLLAAGAPLRAQGVTVLGGDTPPGTSKLQRHEPIVGGLERVAPIAGWAGVTPGLVPLLPLLLLLFCLAACGAQPKREPDGPFVIVLGIAQDAGYPQAACRKPCCAGAWQNPKRRRHVACLAIVDGNRRWLIDCTPDFKDQLRLLDEAAPTDANPGLDGILLTHAHIGHYAGLIHLGREVIGASGVPVYVMPRMEKFLRRNGPWSLIVNLNQIELRPMPSKLGGLSITALRVPHRDEFSETVGFLIKGDKAVLYIPDIDKWAKWDQRIEEWIKKCDVAYLDGTFFENGEIAGRDMSEIPHPFIEESLARFAKLPASERAKIRFIHLNHTNPALRPGKARRRIEAAGCRVAKQGERVSLR